MREIGFVRRTFAKTFANIFAIAASGCRGGLPWFRFISFFVVEDKLAGIPLLVFANKQDLVQVFQGPLRQ